MVRGLKEGLRGNHIRTLLRPQGWVTWSENKRREQATDGGLGTPDQTQEWEPHGPSY